MSSLLLGPSSPTPGLVVIDVWNCRATVSRWAGGGGTYFLESAANAEELADAAAEAVRAQGGGINLSGLYDCPPELAARAVWPAAGAPSVYWTPALPEHWVVEQGGALYLVAANGSWAQRRRYRGHRGALQAADPATTRGVLRALGLLPLPEPPQGNRAVVHDMAQGCRERGLVGLAADLEAIANAAEEPTTAACQRVLEHYRRSRDLSDARHRILLEALNLDE